MTEFFDKECMMLVIMNSEWGKTIADGTQFYRCLFKIDKKEQITTSDVNVMFASFRNWKQKINDMRAECKNQTRDEVDALAYAEKTEADIIQHMHVIVTEKSCIGGDLVNEFINKAKQIKEAEETKNNDPAMQA